MSFNASEYQMMRDAVTGQEPNFTSPVEFDTRGNPLRMRLTGYTEKATLPGVDNERWRAENPAKAVAYKYRTAYDQHRTPAAAMGRTFRGYWDSDDNAVKNLLRRGALPSGIAFGGLGALGGYGLGTLLDKTLDMPFKTRPIVTPALTALMALLGVGASRASVKSASTLTGRGVLRSVVANDATLSFSDKAPLMLAINRLSDGQVQQTAQFMGAGFGAGAGTLVAKGMLGAGAGGQIAGALIGGAIGRRLSMERNLNKRIGTQLLRPGIDAAGNPYRSWR